MSRKHRKAEDEFNAKGYGMLATYNSEVARGIVHTEEWADKMSVLQRRFIREQIAEAEAKGWTIIGSGWGV